MMAHLQKVILLVLVVPLTLFPGGLILYMLLYEQPNFEMGMWIPIGLSILGICSFIFHFRTLGFYKLIKRNGKLPVVDPLLWILDILFGVTYMAISGYIIYLIYLVQSRHPLQVLLLFVIPMLLMGLWTVIEAIYLHKLIQIHKFSNRQAEIEDIKGVRDKQQ